MKPLNYDNSPCSPISSNCVIWQGPDIPCIKLCSGDTISDVVFKLATELCTVLDTLNVTSYDLSCFNLTACGPNDFQALIQFLIDRICALQTELTTVADPATSPITTDNSTKSASNDTLVTVADCFIVERVTVMTVSEYAIAIGKKVCALVTDIALINTQINDLLIRVTDLENTPVTPTPIPTLTLDCTIGSLTPLNSYTIDVILDELINNATNGYCALLSTLGSPSQIGTSLVPDCSFGSDVTSNPDWTATPTTLAESLTNVWIAICDVYSAVSTPITTADTSTVSLSIVDNEITANLTDTGWVDLNGFSYYSGVTKPQCRRIGNQVHFRGNVYIPLENPASPGSVVTLTSEDAYNDVIGCTVWSGGGGCTIIGSTGLQFNNGASVIPSSITSNNFDALYRSGWQTIARQITVKSTNGTALTSVINIFITANKQLEIQTVADIEEGNAPTTLFGNSPFRFITSNVRIGEYLPNYIAVASDIQNAPSNANFPLLSDTFNATWDFSCDAAEADQLGGFEFSLDGMIAYLDPCNIEKGFSAVCP